MNQMARDGIQNVEVQPELVLEVTKINFPRFECVFRPLLKFGCNLPHAPHPQQQHVQFLSGQHGLTHFRPVRTGAMLDPSTAPFQSVPCRPASQKHPTGSLKKLGSGEVLTGAGARYRTEMAQTQHISSLQASLDKESHGAWRPLRPRRACSG